MPKADIFRFGSRGMNANADARLLDATQYHKGINVQLHRQCAGTRCRVKIHQLSGVDISDLNLQGACFYNPGRGQSFQGFGRDFSSIAFAAGGRTFMLLPSEDFNVTEITAGVKRNPSWHTCNLFQSENYLIAQQPTDNTWIYDGKGVARWSAGISVTDKESSEIANGATAGCYVHNRIHQVVNGRQILVGDIIHKSDGSTASNIIRMTEQSYWATGSWFAPPSEWDEIVALCPLAQTNTTDGHGELMCHSPNGVMSLRTGLYPRSAWQDNEMIHHVVVGAGAMGPNAVLPIMEGDQIFRSRYGIQSLRLFPSQNAQFGGPIRQVGEEVDVWLSKDSEQLLYYSSLAKLEKDRRLFCTVAPQIHGNRWMHRGLLSMNLLPSGTRDITPAWEGLLTLPDEAKHPILMVTGEFDRQQRLFVFCYGTDKKLRLAEITAARGDDENESCDRISVPSTIITRAFMGGDPSVGTTTYPLFNKTFSDIGVKFSQIRGRLKWAVHYRTDREPNWRPLTLDGQATFPDCSSKDPFTTFHPGQAQNRYSVPDASRVATWIQIKVSWLGQANLDGVWCDFKTFDPNDQSDFDPVCQPIPVENCDGDFAHTL